MILYIILLLTVIVVLTLLTFWLSSNYKIGISVTNGAMLLGLLLFHSAELPSNVGDPIVCQYLMFTY
jgi:hypothetical protein